MVTALFLLLASQVPAPPVRVWLGSAPSPASGNLGPVYVQTSTDGHLVVLHARPDGRIEVLFPEDPASDPFVRAGSYEIPGPALSGPGGRGMVVAALSPDPIWFDEFVHRSEWDAASLTGAGAGTDPEALLTDIVQRMLGDGSFNYDVATYTVAPPPAAIVDAAGETPQPADACIECSFTQVDIVVSELLRRHFAHRRRRGAAAPAASQAAPPTPAAIAVYSVHQPDPGLELLRLPPPVIVRPPRPVDSSTPRRRTQEIAAAPVPGTFAVRPIPLVAHARSPAAWATVVTRSQLLVRVVHSARSAGVALVPANPPASSWVVAASTHGPAPAPTLATGGVVTVPTAVAAPRVAPETRVLARPAVRTGAAQAGTAVAVPAPSRAGSPAGVGLGAVHTAGWRH